MEACETLMRLYRLAIASSLVKNKSEFAKLIGTSIGTLSNSMNGVKKYKGTANTLTKRAELELIKAGIPQSVVMGDGSSIDASTNINIDASGDHIEAGGNVNNHSTVTYSADVQELISLRVEVQMLREQVAELRKDKDLLTKLLTKE